MNVYGLRNNFTLTNYNTSISKKTFEEAFVKTKESVRFTFNGWDGKSYDGESRIAKVYRASIEGYENVRFIKVGKSFCFIDEDSLVTEKATGEKHPEAQWFIDIER